MNNSIYNKIEKTKKKYAQAIISWWINYWLIRNCNSDNKTEPHQN